MIPSEYSQQLEFCRSDSSVSAESDRIKWNKEGLIPVVVQEASTNQVLMQAWMNPEAFRITCETGFATYFSRSRQSLWKKGETSGCIQRVQSIYVDCDKDALLLRVEQKGGGSCHTGADTCFERICEFKS
ncbi:MAG: phosphoribosyl-AMP cyclohydrolase [Gammaproteobacteria bacterium]|nr:phosphoribosyl-AMP cyclohydrolase [Gammaproteobacteria bacterium]